MCRLIFTFIDEACGVIFSQKPVDFRLRLHGIAKAFAASDLGQMIFDSWNIFVVDFCGQLGASMLRFVEMDGSFVAEQSGQILHVQSQPSHWYGLGREGVNI